MRLFGSKTAVIAASEVVEALEKTDLFKILKRVRSLSNDHSKSLKRVIEMLEENQRAVEALDARVAGIQKEVGVLKDQISLIPGLDDVAARLGGIRVEVEGLREGMASTALVTGLLNRLVDKVEP